jgi:hypothetical protein
VEKEMDQPCGDRADYKLAWKGANAWKIPRWIYQPSSTGSVPSQGTLVCPMQRAANTLRRWMALDADLHQGELRISEFAVIRLVAPKTVRRDLTLFKRLG